MEIKLFEVRDERTRLEVLALRLEARNATEAWLLDRSGYGADSASQSKFTFCCVLDPRNPENFGQFKFTYDPNQWGDNRTMALAHDHICRNWPGLRSGDVIDVAQRGAEQRTHGIRPLVQLPKTGTIDQKELERLAVIAAKRAGLGARCVQTCENPDDPDLPAVWIGHVRLQCSRTTIVRLDCSPRPPTAETIITVWRMNHLSDYGQLREALCEAVAAEAYERADGALWEEGLEEPT